MSSPDPQWSPPGPPIARAPLPPPTAKSTAAAAEEPPAETAEDTAEKGRRRYSAVSILVGLAVLMGGACLTVVVARTVRPLIQEHFVKPWREEQRRAELDEFIVRLKQGPHHEERHAAAEQIVACGAEAVVKALDALTAVESKGLATYPPANEALAEMGARILPVLMESLESPKVDRRAAAACVLRAMGPAAEPAMPVVVKRLSDSNLWLRALACDIVANVGPKGAAAVEGLRNAARPEEDPLLRRRAVVALGKVGPAAKSSVDLLMKIQDDDPQDDIALAAATALYEIDLQGMAQRALGHARPEIRTLIAKLSATDPFEAVAAAKQLGAKGHDARWAVAALAEALEYKSKWIREAAANALGKLGPDARPLLPALERAAHDPEEDVRKAAEEAVAALSK